MVGFQEQRLEHRLRVVGLDQGIDVATVVRHEPRLDDQSAVGAQLVDT
jgi:hypothetical protein